MKRILKEQINKINRLLPKTNIVEIEEQNESEVLDEEVFLGKALEILLLEKSLNPFIPIIHS